MTDQQPAFSIEKIYVKDVSLEVPGAPQVFLQPEQPQVEVQLGQATQQVQEGLFEVSLKVTITAKSGDKTVFLAEAEQAARQALPAPYRGRSARSLIAPMRKTIIGYQHPLAVYEDLMPGGAI